MLHFPPLTAHGAQPRHGYLYTATDRADLITNYCEDSVMAVYCAHIIHMITSSSHLNTLISHDDEKRFPLFNRSNCIAL